MAVRRGIPDPPARSARKGRQGPRQAAVTTRLYFAEFLEYGFETFSIVFIIGLWDFMLNQCADPDPVVLVVDLDGTLLRIDMLHESFWSAFGLDWRAPFFSARALSNGRASLKRHLAKASAVEAATIPYNETVVAFVRQWRRDGAAPRWSRQATRVSPRPSRHIWASSTRCMDRTGRPTRRARRRRSSSRRVSAPGLRCVAERCCDQTEYLVTRSGAAAGYLAALRPHQWLKNTFVFLPVLAAQQFDFGTVLLSILAFACFNLVASGVYVMNDLLDLTADRAHPRKRNRPFASGRIPVSNGWWMLAGLVLAGLLFAALVGPTFLLIIVAYLMLTTAYSLFLKRNTVIDICLLAGLYTLRIVAGGLATGIPLSMWLLTFSVFFFLSLAAVKRQAELVDSAVRGDLAASGRGYVVDDLPIIAMVVIGAGYVSVLVMTLYVESPDVTATFATPEALWGVCAVLLYWITRTVMVAHRGQMHDDPVIYAAKDRISQVCLVLIMGFVAAGAVI